ncbi:TPA: hypothetical protein EYP45_04260 [Candidatus Peregrinibacteria bacterium]|nr:hypothetical protein [Candidatus Peregrinibacteria bacterium]HIQ57219.1 hypothetical protein [Candidatus Gracilibacteria bacterium]
MNVKNVLADSIPNLDSISDFYPSDFTEFIEPDTLASNSGIFGHWFFTDAIPAWVSYGVSLSVAIAILLIVVAGIYLMTSPELTDMKEKAINTIKWSIVGLIIIMLSYTIVEVLNNIAFSTGTNPSVGIDVESNSHLDNLVKGNLTQELIPELIQTILKLMGTIALLLFIYAGGIMALRDGDDEKVTKAKNIIIYVVIGAVVSLIAYLVVEAVIQFDFN